MAEYSQVGKALNGSHERLIVMPKKEKKKKKGVFGLVAGQCDKCSSEMANQTTD